MKTSKFIKPLIGIVCVFVIVLAVVLALWLDGRSSEPASPNNKKDSASQTTEQTTEQTEGAENEPADPTQPSLPEDEQVPGPSELPPTVELPQETNPETGEKLGIKFPCTVPGHKLVIEKLDAYEGVFVEDGSNQPAQNVAMLLVHNTGDTPLEYTQLQVKYKNATLLFDISALPAGEKLVVQEKTGKSLPEGDATAAKALVIHRADLSMSRDQVQVTDNGDNTLTVKNLTDKTIPTVRVFYKYYMENEGLFVGGIAFTVRVTRLGPGASVTIQPSHYTSQSSRVVMVLTYDSEV